MLNESILGWWAIRLHDLEAGRAAGVKIGAVAWGPFDHDLLKKHQPEAFFNDLSALEELFIG